MPGVVMPDTLYPTDTDTLVMTASQNQGEKPLSLYALHFLLLLMFITANHTSLVRNNIKSVG